MTITELATYTPSLGEQMEFARAVVLRPEGAARSLLPESYRDNPANVLLAVGLGQAMGLSPAESLYRIDVIQGKPCASAELIAANVRKAGHKCRVKVIESPPSASCTIIRADDPDEPTTITRDMAWAKGMGLADKDNYRKQPATMLSWRAVSACARLACPEALYGVSHTPDEMTDFTPSHAPSAGLSAALHVEQVTPDTSGPEDAPAPPEAVQSPDTSGPESPLLDTSSGLAKRMFALFGDVGLADREARLAYVSDVVGREVESSASMTDADAEQVIAALETDLDQPFPETAATP